MGKIIINSQTLNKLMKIPKNSLNLKCKTHKVNLINKQPKNNKRMKINHNKNSHKHSNKPNRLNKPQKQSLQSISPKKIFMILLLESKTKSKKISNPILMTFITLKPEPTSLNNNINLRSKECIYGNFIIP